MSRPRTLENARAAPSLSDGLRHWLAFNNADDIAAELGTLRALFDVKPSRQRRIAQAYATAFFLRGMGISDGTIQLCLDRFYFPEATERRKRRNSRIFSPEKYQGDANTGAHKAMYGPRSISETVHGEEIIRLISGDEVQHAAHLRDLQRIFEPELSIFPDINSTRLSRRQACSSKSVEDSKPRS
ncbi:hypothetical protein [Bradyrhizobium liaoningense]|uniref:hypothetical protein n=1 Tax=Bradyrhizobium liaoningense TaxID=43992 RepID=UPI001BAABCC9|nr:hypothetical protein [Bradyrhizobium liaoningense]MBR0982335.1 hypothetical protein [Bradyrhizobium liaoningense]